MAILVDERKRVIVQGITGREGSTRTRLMQGYHTQIVGGVTPGKGGLEVEGVPVFDTVRAATDHLGTVDISVIFVPAPLVKNAAIEAFEAGVKLLLIVPDRVPIYDVLEIDAVAKQHAARFIGPNTLGILSPNRGVLGMIGGRSQNARDWFFEGPVGISSRSGGITTTIAYYLAQAGIGASTLVHVGGDAIVGMPHPAILKEFEADPHTEAVVMFGEIGTSQEEGAAHLIETGQFTKPLIAYIGGKAAKQGTRFSHAGAIIEGDRGTYENKVTRLRDVGAHIVEHFTDIPRVTGEVLNKKSTFAVSKPNIKNAGAVDLHWTTAITRIEPNQISVRNHPIEQLMENLTFSQAIYLVLTGRMPTKAVGAVLDAILVASIDHGATPPSTLAARTSASTGAPFNAAIAAGLLSINKHHGAAIENCMGVIQDALQLMRDKELDGAAAAKQLVSDYRKAKRRLPGFGHRIHTQDPRVQQLLGITSNNNLAGEAIAMLTELHRELEHQSGRKLPINVDGAIAAVLLDIGIPKALGNTFFMMARVPGMIAHIHEETTQQPPMRHIHPLNHSFEGDEFG